VTTTEQMIGGAMRLIGALAAGETMAPADAQDGLAAFNQMVDSWSTERLAVYTTQDQVFTWPIGAATRSIGPTGDFVGQRPIALDTATYFVDPGTGISYNVVPVNEEQYNSIALKSATSTFPQWVWMNEAFPDADLTVFPVPARALEWHIVSVLPLTGSASLSTPLLFPPGYIRAFRFCLACELAPEFGAEPPPQVRRVATAAKRNLKRINDPMDLLGMPPAILRQSRRFNIYAGSY
jgi:hypothetical protein